MANGYESPQIKIPTYTSPTQTSQGKVNVYDRIRKEKESQEQLRKQLIQDKIDMGDAVLGNLKGRTSQTFDKNTTHALNSLVDNYVDIKNGMMKSEGEDGYVPTQIGVDALRQIQEQAGDISFFNNQLSKDLLPHLREMILKPADQGYEQSKGAMSSITPTTAQRIVMAVDNNHNVSWEFTENGELELVMPGGEEDGVKYEEIRFNLNEYGKYIEKGEEFFTAIPNIDDELTAAAEIVIGTPEKPKITDGVYYTYDTTADGNIKFNTVELKEDDRKKAVKNLMELEQFDDLLNNPNRSNDRKALWQDCVTTPGSEGYGQDDDFDDNDKEQKEILHKWLAETAIEKNLAHGVHVTGVGRDGGGGGYESPYTKEFAQNLRLFKPVFDKNLEAVVELGVDPKKYSEVSKGNKGANSILVPLINSFPKVMEENRKNNEVYISGDKLSKLIDKNPTMYITEDGADPPKIDKNKIYKRTRNEEDDAYELDIAPIDISSQITLLNTLNQLAGMGNQYILELNRINLGSTTETTTDNKETTESTGELD